MQKKSSLFKAIILLFFYVTWAVAEWQQVKRKWNFEFGFIKNVKSSDTIEDFWVFPL